MIPNRSVPPRSRAFPDAKTFSAFSFRALAFMALALTCLLPAARIMAQDAADNQAGTDDQAAESAREAFQDGNYNWYDVEEDALRPLNVNPPAEPYDWSWLWEWIPDWQWDWDIGGVNFAFSFVELLGWILLGVVFGVIAYVIAKMIIQRNRFFVDVSDDAHVAEEVSLAERVEALPVRVSRDVDDLLAEAKRHYENGNFREAIVYLYSHQLVTLDKHHVIRLAKGKTNRQYAREILRGGQQGLSDLLEGTLVAFEDVFFGNHAIDRERFESCWTRLPEFDRLLREEAP